MSRLIQLFRTYPILKMLACAGVLLLLWQGTVHAQDGTGTGLSLPKISFGVDSADNSKDFVVTLQVLMMLTVLTLAPSILIMMTCFYADYRRFSLSQASSRYTVAAACAAMVGLALFLTLFVMSPVLDEANEKGLQPYLRDEISQTVAVDNMIKPFRAFMLKHTREEDLGLFIKLKGDTKPKSIDEVSIMAIIPAYTISELRMGFQIGFIIFIPFLVIDMIISSILMSLGMMLLPPQLISLPVKVLLFILVDGWALIVSTLMESIVR